MIRNLIFQILLSLAVAQIGYSQGSVDIDDLSVQMGVASKEKIRITDANFSIHSDVGQSPLLYGDFLSGNLMIGTTASRYSGVNIESLSNYHISLFRNTTGANGPTIRLGKTGSGTLNGNTIVSNNDRLGLLMFMAGDGAGSDASSVAEIGSFVDGSPSGSLVKGKLTFSTQGGAGLLERMVINSDGEVGIGNASPSQKLDVTGNINASGRISTGSTVIGSGSINSYNLAGNTTTFGSKLDVKGEVIARDGIRMVQGGTYGSAIDETLLTYSMNQNVRNSSRTTGWKVKVTSNAGSTQALRMVFYPGYSSVYSSANNANLNVLRGSVLTLWSERNTRRVGIRNDNPSYELDVSGTIRANNVSASDRVWKKEIKPISNATGRLKLINPVSYSWRTDEFPEENFDDHRHMGVIAQELETVLPELVYVDNEGYRSVDYTSLIALLIKAVQEKDDELTDLRGQITDLINQIAGLKSNQVERLEFEKLQTQLKSLSQPPKSMDHHSGSR